MPSGSSDLGGRTAFEMGERVGSGVAGGSSQSRVSVQGCTKGLWRWGEAGLGQLKHQGSLRARRTLLLFQPFQRRALF